MKKSTTIIEHSSSAASGQVMGTRQLPHEGHMAARTRLEQVRMVILQRRVRETQFRSEPAGAFQSHIAHITERDRVRSSIR